MYVGDITIRAVRDDESCCSDSGERVKSVKDLSVLVGSSDAADHVGTSSSSFAVCLTGTLALMRAALSVLTSPIY